MIRPAEAIPTGLDGVEIALAQWPHSLVLTGLATAVKLKEMH